MKEGRREGAFVHLKDNSLWWADTAAVAASIKAALKNMVTAWSVWMSGSQIYLFSNTRGLLLAIGAGGLLCALTVSVSQLANGRQGAGASGDRAAGSGEQLRARAAAVVAFVEHLADTALPH